MKTKTKTRLVLTRISMLIVTFCILAMLATSAAFAQKVIKGSPTPAGAPPPPPPPPLPPSPQAIPESEIIGKDTIYTLVDIMPEYPGGDQGLLEYIATNTKYPAAAKTAGIQGKVLIKFCVTKNGNVDKISILKGVNSEIDTEAQRVVATLSTFKPGKINGKNVNVWYMVPISFALK